jgi:hypothetical protein
MTGCAGGLHPLLLLLPVLLVLPLQGCCRLVGALAGRQAADLWSWGLVQLLLDQRCC